MAVYVLYDCVENAIMGYSHTWNITKEAVIGGE